MRDFVGHKGRLRVLPPAGKLLYTAFLLSVACGLYVSYLLYGDATREIGAGGYYAGVEASLPAARPATVPAGGPALELPDDDAAPARMAVPMSERKLLEVTHFHLFSIPVYALIVAHLWLIAGAGALWRGLGAAGVVLTSFAHIAAPWVVRHAASGAWASGAWASGAWLMPASGIAMALAYFAVIAATLVDMWMPLRRGGS